MKNQRNLSSCFRQEKGNNHFKMPPELLVLINKGLPSRETLVADLNQHEIHPSLTNKEEGEYPNLATSSLPVSPKGKKEGAEMHL